MFFQGYQLGLLVLVLGLALVIAVLSIWWRDVIREALFQGHHTIVVQSLIKSGFGLFILSEVMFFVAWFWAYFHCTLCPPIELGCFVPSNSVDLVSTWGVPWFNTVLLLSSGATVTVCHHSLMANRYKDSITSLEATIWLAMIFTFWQGYEYQTTFLNISDGAAGSTFFLATGFHGIHVIIGTAFLSVSLVRQLLYHYSMSHLVGFEAASWYFHFVDVVWLALFLTIYWWGNLVDYLY
jgi:cytochrome c oxidase subunit 3